MTTLALYRISKGKTLTVGCVDTIVGTQVIEADVISAITMILSVTEISMRERLAYGSMAAFLSSS